MDTPVTAAEFKAAFERSLTPDEERVLPTWLDIAWRKLQRAVGGIPARLALPTDTAGHLAIEDVQDVVIAMVERKVRNPDGTRSYGADDYNETVDSVLSSGQIYATDDEIRSLSVRDIAGGNGLFSIPLGR